MLASLLSPTSSAPPAARISQLLPSVKCSTCHQPVPLAELGDHTCEDPPPVPSLPKPTITQEAATALLPGRLQGRVASPSSPPRAQEHQRVPSSASARLRINTKGGGSPAQATFQPKSSPLARSDSTDVKVPFPTSLPLRTRPPASDVRMRTPSISNQSTPATARPSISFANQDSTPITIAPPPRNGNASSFPTSPSRGPPQGPPPQRMGLPPNPNNHAAPGGPGPYNPPPQAAPLGLFPNRPGPSGGAGPLHHPPVNMDPRPSFPPDQTFVPPAERGIDTKSGGEAGMAGVGRRGFAAAARAAMFVGLPQGPQPLYGRRMNSNAGPRYLDIDAASRSTETPPLSAGSGYSSHSPGPTSPLPQSDFSLQPNPGLAAKAQVPRTPSPGRQFLVTPTPAIPTTQSQSQSQSENTNHPLFVADNVRGRMANELPNPSITNPTPPPPQSILPRNTSSASSKSAYSHMSRKTAPKVGSPPSPIESESEYGGLAYANSTDYEDDDPNDITKKSNEKKRSYDVRESLVQALNDAATRKGGRHIQFGSVSLRSRSRSSSIGDRKSTSTNGGAKARLPIVGASRADSVSSYSSTSSAGGDSAIRARARADSSSTVARALGLSQTPPSEYAKLGGPGVKGVGGRMRSASGASSASNGTNSNSTSNLRERGMETLMEDDVVGLGKTTMASSPEGKQRSLFGSVSSGRSALRRADTAESTSSRDERSKRLQDDAGESIIGGISGGSKAHRSNTVPGHQPQQVQSPDGGKPIKLPTRSLTSPHTTAVPLGDDRVSAKGKGVLKERAAKKVRACLRCAKTIENGRWVSVDGGGVLCENCWKYMYLPKCRRCNLPIERAAVSSSDGQLKGKYHKECFNCHTCQKPFPDKTFYVYDGKPLCAYHYHEANDSLCAAARCGQPIEGPCAVSHTGDRYHPEHMTCEYPGYPACRERLEEYWEVEGRMLCERHANGGEGSVGGSGGEEDVGGEERWVRGAKAMKRVTRFIDLAGAGVGGVPVEGSELR